MLGDYSVFDVSAATKAADLMARRRAELSTLPVLLPRWHADGWAFDTLSDLIPR